MKISFAELGIEECELCDEQKIHLQGKIQSHLSNYDESAVVRKKTKKVTIENNSGICSDECSICERYLMHIKERDNSRKEHKDDKPLSKHVLLNIIKYISADLQ